MPDKDRGSVDLTSFNLVAATVLVSFGTLALFYLIPNHVPASAVDDQGLGARFMPTLAASALTFLAGVLGINVYLRKVRDLDPIPEDNEDNDVQGFGKRESFNAIALILGAAVYVLLLSTTGFVIASSIGLFCCLYLGGSRNWLFIGILSVGIPLLLAQVLWWTLTIRMPVFSLFG